MVSNAFFPITLACCSLVQKKLLGSSGTADPLNQRATVGWKLAKTAEILSQENMVRIECAASATTGGSVRYQ